MSALFHPYLCGRIAAEWLIFMNTHMKTCYGVSRNDRNELVANQFAANVQKIYALYLSGRSLRDICKSLQEACIYSPSGKSEWTPRAIENVLSNATYINIVISEDTFNQVRAEQVRRSNATTTEHSTIRKTTRYNSKCTEWPFGLSRMWQSLPQNHKT